jgi:hypothetical protein
MTHPLLPLARREFLRTSGRGCGALALAHLLGRDGRLSAAEKPPHFAPKAKSVIWLFMNGGPSQVDTFDYKPELQKRDGQTLSGADPKTGFFTTSGKCLKSPFQWKQHGDQHKRKHRHNYHSRNSRISLLAEHELCVHSIVHIMGKTQSAISHQAKPCARCVSSPRPFSSRGGCTPASPRRSSRHPS